MPSICRFDQLGDWFESLADILHWNLRQPQLGLVADRKGREDDQSPTDDNSGSSLTPTSESSEEA